MLPIGPFIWVPWRLPNIALMVALSFVKPKHPVWAIGSLKDKSITEADIRAHCKAHLTPYKVPKRVVFEDDLPKSNVGKILRKDLRARELARIAAE